MKLLPVLLLLVAFQQPVIEYGQPSELKGVTSIFIDAGTDLKSRNQILKELKAANIPNLCFLDSPDQAQVVLLFTDTSETYVSGATINDSSTTLAYRRLKSGKGLILIPKGGNRVRVLLDFSGTKRSIWKKNPPVQFARAFIKAYREANR